MNYYVIRTNDPDRLILKQSKIARFALIALLSAIGIPCLFGGAMLFFSPAETGSAAFWTGAGLLFISGAWGLASRFRLPESFVFDNASGSLLVREKNGTVAALPYSDIEGFRVNLRRQNRSSFYAAEMIKKDGACWAFATFSGMEQARRMCDMLSGSVNLEKRSLSRTAEPLPPGIERREDPGTTTLSLKPEMRFLDYLFALTAVASMVLMLFGSLTFMTGTVTRVIAIVLAAGLAGLTLVSLVFNAGRIFYLKVTRDDLKFEWRGGIMPASGFTMPLSELDAVLFNFSPTRIERGLYLLRKDEKKLYQEIGHGLIKPGDLSRALPFMIKARKIDASTLLTAEKVRLERLLQEIIAARSSRTGI